MLKHPLYDPTAIRMCGQTVNLSRESIYDELNMFCWYPFDCFLYHVISILVFDALEHIVLEFFHKRCLLIGQNVLESLDELVEPRKNRDSAWTYLLYDSTAIHLLR